ncbi:hypothetical protein PIB30_094385, partial [Stylosanthes scabra]|nr:hypothetical protein [Stylosanthes scabra]
SINPRGTITLTHFYYLIRSGALAGGESETPKGFLTSKMFVAAWDRAKAQDELFASGVSFEKMDPVKVVYKGELVDDDQVPAEGSDDHNPGE